MDAHAAERDKLMSVIYVDNTSELRQSTAIVYQSNHQALRIARFLRAGQLATADTCLSLWSYSWSQQIAE